MRLWHEALLPYLPRQQLLGQHRECCALRGKGWGKKHAIVDYVFQHSYQKLYQYHLEVMKEMEHRGYMVDPLWFSPEYRGKNSPPIDNESFIGKIEVRAEKPTKGWIYQEHHSEYLKECLENLARKGIRLEIEENGKKPE